LLDAARFELRELRAHSTLLGTCTTCPLLRSELEVLAVVIEDLKHKLDHSSRYTILSPPCEACASLKGKLFHATKENTELQQEVAYLTACLEKTILREKMIKDDLSRVKKSASKSTYKLGIEFARCDDKGEKSAPKFISSSSYHKEEETLKPTKTHYPYNPKPSFNPKREVKRESPKPREKVFICMFYGRADHLDKFCFRCKRLERRRFEYARNSYRDVFFYFLSCSYSRASPYTSSRAFPQFSYRPGFPVERFHTRFEPTHLDGPRSPHRGSHPTRLNGEVQKIVKTFSSRMVKCWITKIYLTNPNTESSTFSHPM
jgi:predicted Zn-ribbon and HTH transcriptional regulator